MAPSNDGVGGRVSDWHWLLRSATSEEEIAGVTRDYLATWTPEEIAALPAECRPPRVRDGEDISQWAFNLARARAAAPGPESEALLDKLAGFVGDAIARLAEVKARAETA